MARTDPTIYMRIPQELKDALDKASEENRRSLTAEVVARLQATFDETIVTTVEARARIGAEEKRFEFNADEIADKVVERLAGRAKPRTPNRVILVGNLGSDPTFRSAYEHYANVVVRGKTVTSATLEGAGMLPPPRGNEPYGPKKSSNVPKTPPKKK